MRQRSAGVTVRPADVPMTKANILRRCILPAFMLTLAGCTPATTQFFSTQQSRIGPDDGSDSCRQRVVGLDNTGQFFGRDILTGAAAGGVAGGVLGYVFGGHDWQGALIGASAGAAAGGLTAYVVDMHQRLATENQHIDDTQLAFNALMDCRFEQARAIRADYRARIIDRPTAQARMAKVKAWAQRDLALARTIDTNIRDRGSQFELAADKVAPGSSAAAAAQVPTPRHVTVRRTVALRLNPDAGAPDIGRVPAGQSVSATPVGGRYALVETSGGQRGYVETSALKGSVGPPPSGLAAPTAASGADTPEAVRSLAGSNAARRDAFEQSVVVAEAATTGGFQSVD